MSCALALIASLALADAYGASGAATTVTPVSAPANPLAAEPLYSDIVSRAGALKARIAVYRVGAMKSSLTPLSLDGFGAFKTDTDALAALDMRGHFDLKARASDGDLKCILKGISEDLPKKIATVEDAKTGAQQDQALDELSYLLNDNVEVITSPPKPPV
jgi:hypothetical protein